MHQILIYAHARTLLRMSYTLYKCVTIPKLFILHYRGLGCTPNEIEDTCSCSYLGSCYTKLPSYKMSEFTPVSTKRRQRLAARLAYENTKRFVIRHYKVCHSLPLILEPRVIDIQIRQTTSQFLISECINKETCICNYADLPTVCNKRFMDWYLFKYFKIRKWTNDLWYAEKFGWKHINIEAPQSSVVQEKIVIPQPPRHYYERFCKKEEHNYGRIYY